MYTLPCIALLILFMMLWSLSSTLVQSFVNIPLQVAFILRMYAWCLQGMHLMQYVRTGADPAAVAVMMEDGAAVAGLAIAGGCLALCQITGNHIYDAVGSMAVATLLGAVAVVLIQRNRQWLIGKVHHMHWLPCSKHCCALCIGSDLGHSRGQPCCGLQHVVSYCSPCMALVATLLLQTTCNCQNRERACKPPGMQSNMRYIAWCTPAEYASTDGVEGGGVSAARPCYQAGQ